MCFVVVQLSVLCLMSDRCFFFQAEDGIRDLVRSRGLGDVYKRQVVTAILALLGVILYVTGGQAGWHGDRLFVILKDLSLIHI